MICSHTDANAIHVCFCHNLAGANDETDKGLIHRKKTRFTITRVLVQSKHEFWTKEMALNAWINKFLPKGSGDLFPGEVLEKLRSWVRQIS